MLKPGLALVSQELGADVQVVVVGLAMAVQPVPGKIPGTSAAGGLAVGGGFQADRPVLEEQFWWWCLSHGGL